MYINSRYTNISTDEEGFLCDMNDWNESVACYLAKIEQLELTDAHWLVIRFVREFYQEYQHTPAIRALVKSLKLAYGPEVGNSIYLQQLFPAGPAKQVAKIAGLPKPSRCL